MSLGLLAALALLAFTLEYVDACLGMGYGTVLVPALLVMGFSPLEVIPAAIASQLVGDLVASAFHHKLGNACFNPGSLELHAALLLGGSGVVAPLAASLIALRLPAYMLKGYVALMTTGIGVLLLADRRLSGGLTRGRALLLSLLAGFNKGLTGGGYGPLVAGGQVLLGAEARSAVAVTALAEALTCAVATLSYYVAGALDVYVAGALALGTALSAPLAALTVRRASPTRLRRLMGLAALGLGLACLASLIM